MPSTGNQIYGISEVLNLRKPLHSNLFDGPGLAQGHGKPLSSLWPLRPSTVAKLWQTVAVQNGPKDRYNGHKGYDKGNCPVIKPANGNYTCHYRHPSPQYGGALSRHTGTNYGYLPVCGSTKCTTIRGSAHKSAPGRTAMALGLAMSWP